MPEQDTPQPESLAGWMRRWLKLPTVGLPEAKALLAAEEERRRALRQQLSDAIPERLKSLAGMATDYLGQQFTPSPEMTEVGTQLKAMTNGGPVYGPMARFGVDQFVDSTTPGGAMTNLDLPVGELAKVAGTLALMRGGLKVVGGADDAARAALDLSHAARMERAAAQGFTQDVYHGTQAKTSWMDNPELMQQFNEGIDIPEHLARPDALRDLRRGQTGLKMMDGMGVHVGTPEAAAQRLETNVGAKFGTPARSKDAGPLAGSYVLPLKARTEKPLTKADGSYYTESELQARLSAIAKKLGFTDTRRYSQHSRAGGLREAQNAVKQYLQEQGYDSMPYINSHEGRGSVSWVLFEPNQVRSATAAAFDPAKIGSKELLASILGGVGLSQLVRPTEPPQ